MSFAILLKGVTHPPNRIATAAFAQVSSGTKGGVFRSVYPQHWSSRCKALCWTWLRSIQVSERLARIFNVLNQMSSPTTSIRRAQRMTSQVVRRRKMFALGRRMPRRDVQKVRMMNTPPAMIAARRCQCCHLNEGRTSDVPINGVFRNRMVVEVEALVISERTAGMKSTPSTMSAAPVRRKRRSRTRKGVTILLTRILTSFHRRVTQTTGSLLEFLEADSDSGIEKETDDRRRVMDSIHQREGVNEWHNRRHEVAMGEKKKGSRKPS